MIRVAVCDDVQEVVAQVNSYLLEYQNIRNRKFDIISFNNAEDLRDHLKTNNCDIIILDIELVKMNGVELGKWIRTELNDHALKIIYISALDIKEKQESAFIKQQNEYYVNQLTAVEELYQTSREAQHSIKNHLLTILPYL